MPDAVNLWNQEFEAIQAERELSRRRYLAEHLVCVGFADQKHWFVTHHLLKSAAGPFYRDDAERSLDELDSIQSSAKTARFLSEHMDPHFCPAGDVSHVDLELADLPEFRRPRHGD